MPQIDAGSSTDFIWMYYDNPSATAPPPTTAVWDANYKGVWHLDEASGTTNFDSTVNANHGTKVSATEPNPVTTGKIDGAQDFDGSNDYISTSNSFNNPQDFTISAWFKTSSA